MMERNELKSVMLDVVGQLVLKSKANVSYDCDAGDGQYPFVAKAALKPGLKAPPRTEFKRAFIARTKAAREARELTQVEIAGHLQIAQDKYKQYETRSYLPYDLIPTFCVICDVNPTWLLTGGDYRPPVKTTRPKAA